MFSNHRIRVGIQYTVNVSCPFIQFRMIFCSKVNLAKWPGNNSFYRSVGFLLVCLFAKPLNGQTKIRTTYLKMHTDVS